MNLYNFNEIWGIGQESTTVGIRIRRAEHWKLMPLNDYELQEYGINYREAGDIEEDDT